MSLWHTWRQTKQKWKVVFIGGAVLLIAVLFFSPFFSADAQGAAAGQEAVNAADTDGEEEPQRDPTNGIIALGVLLVLIVVLSTTRILTLDRQHRPHLRKLPKQKNGEPGAK